MPSGTLMLSRLMFCKIMLNNILTIAYHSLLVDCTVRGSDEDIILVLENTKNTQ